VTAARVIFVSDTHLSPDAPEAQDNWAAVVRHIDAAAPDLVIHLGDLSLDGARNPADIDYARRQLDLLPVAWHAIPGNHDIGDNPFPGAPESMTVTDARRQRWLDAIGPDYWSLNLPGWVLLAVNAQLAGSGLASEASQWLWLADRLARVSSGQRIALLTHKPITAGDAEVAEAPPYRFWPPAASSRLAEEFEGESVALVVSGHVHQSRILSMDGTQHLWVPTTWAVLPDHAQAVLGAKRAGIMSLEFGTGLPVRPDFHEPAGIRQLTMTADIPDRYNGR
jgi:3',5'-cyclic AMP phosphodiesterase CpdA